MKISLSVILMFFAMGLGAVGCGTRENAAHCHGKITLNGQAVPRGTVTFYAAKEGVGVSGDLDSEGNYTLMESVPPGPYQVFVLPNVPSPFELEQNPNLQVEDKTIPLKYRSSKTSGLTADLKNGQNEKSFDLVQ